MNASFVNGSHCCLKTVGKYPIITLWFVEEKYAQTKIWLSSCVYSSPIRFHRKIPQRLTHTCTHTPTWADWPSFPPLSECAGADSDKHFVKNFSPLPALFSVLPPPSIPLYVPSLSAPSTPLSACLHPILFIQAWPRTPRTPLWSLFFHCCERREMHWVGGIDLICVQSLSPLFLQ